MCSSIAVLNPLRESPTHYGSIVWFNQTELPQVKNLNKLYKEFTTKLYKKKELDNKTMIPIYFVNKQKLTYKNFLPRNL